MKSNSAAWLPLAILLASACQGLAQSVKNKSFEPTNCPVHKKELREGVVPIRYGMPAPMPKPLQEAQAKLFPLARRFVLGGCVVHDVKTAKVRYCQDCRSAETKWRRANPEIR